MDRRLLLSTGCLRYGTRCYIRNPNGTTCYTGQCDNTNEYLDYKLECNKNDIYTCINKEIIDNNDKHKYKYKIYFTDTNNVKLGNHFELDCDMYDCLFAITAYEPTECCVQFE